MSSSTSRRQFLSRTAAIGAGFGVWSSRSPVVRANESVLQGLSAACIGVGGKGSSDTSHIAEQGVSIVGLCDVDGGTVDKKVTRVSRCRKV